MGYYTNFCLSVEAGLDDSAQMDRVRDWLLKNSVMGDFFEFTDYGDVLLYEAKWYESDEEMYALSKAFPEFLFCLHGSGESDEDLWNEYWQDGLRQLCMAEIPPYDPQKMETRR